MSDFIIEDGVLTKYVGPGGNVVLPKQIRKIGMFAFQDCVGLESVEIPQRVESIGLQAFYRCSNLKSVSIPDGVAEIESVAFGKCGSLTEIQLPPGIKEIRAGLFDGCSSLKRVTVPAGVTSIQKYAFRNCGALAELIIPDSVAEIETGCLKGCRDLRIVITGQAKQIASPRKKLCVIQIERWTPAITKLTQSCRVERIITDDLAQIPTKYWLGIALDMIDRENFPPDSALGTEILDVLKKNYKKLLPDVRNHPQLFHLMCEQKMIRPTDVDFLLEEAEKHGDTASKMMLLQYQHELGDKVHRERAKREKAEMDYVEGLAKRAADRDISKSIQGVTFTVTGKLSNVWSSRKEVQDYLEAYGAKLASSVTGKTDFLVTNDQKSSSEKNKQAAKLGVPILTEEDFNHLIGKRYKKDQKQVEIPVWLTSVPEEAFCSNWKLESVSIPEGITEIGPLAFFGCKKLESISLPQSVIRIGNSAFATCEKLKQVLIANPEIQIGSGAFSDCKQLSGADGFVIINRILFQYYGRGGNVVIPDGITRIDAGAFSKCSKLTGVTLPQGVTEIGYAAFTHCEKLANITIPEGMKKIGNSAFSDCSCLTNIVLPEGVTEIGDSAFIGCESLTSVAIPNGVEIIGYNMFGSCFNLESISVPKTVTCIDPFAFLNCPKLTIHAPAGSYAERYAKEHGIPFEAE